MRLCTYCKTPYDLPEQVQGAANLAQSFAPFCSKRCADADLSHWLKGEYIIGGEGSLVVNEDLMPNSPLTKSHQDGLSDEDLE